MNTASMSLIAPVNSIVFDKTLIWHNHKYIIISTKYCGTNRDFFNCAFKLPYFDIIANFKGLLK